MGTDAYAFIEFWAGPDSVPVWGEVTDPATIVVSPAIESPTRCGVRIGRQYALFGALAGVRSSLRPLIEPRGLPPVIGGEVFHAAFHPICADDVPTEFAPDAIRHSEAIRRVESGMARYGGQFCRGNYDFVTAGAFHASWMYVREIEAASAHHGIMSGGDNILFASALASMRLLESRLGPDRSRLVFWFDTM